MTTTQKSKDPQKLPWDSPASKRVRSIVGNLSGVMDSLLSSHRRLNAAVLVLTSVLLGACALTVMQVKEAQNKLDTEFRENARIFDAQVQLRIDEAHDVAVVVDDANSPLTSRYVTKSGTCLQYAFMVPASSIQTAAGAKHLQRPLFNDPSRTPHPVIENDIKGAYTYIENHPNLEPVCVSSRNQKEVDPFWKYGKGPGVDGFDDGTIVGGLPYRYGSEGVTVLDRSSIK